MRRALALALLAVAVAGSLAAKDVPILREWSGRVDVEAPGPPAFVSDGETLARVWRQLKIEGKPPEIDFTNRLVLGASGRSSVVQIRPSLDATGNLARNVVATPDYPNFKTYVLVEVSRDGVRTVDGQALSK